MNEHGPIWSDVERPAIRERHPIASQFLMVRDKAEEIRHAVSAPDRILWSVRVRDGSVTISAQGAYWE